MITSRRRKTLLVSAVLISISGFSVFAEAPQVAGSGNNMSQSSMVDVKSGQATGEREISNEIGKADALAVEQSQQTVAVGDASLYLSAEDDAAIASQEGKTLLSISKVFLEKSNRNCILCCRANRVVLFLLKV